MLSYNDEHAKCLEKSSQTDVEQNGFWFSLFADGRHVEFLKEVIGTLESALM
jgi:hypothetical protein